ncbi:hypothetical protein [Streptomyces tendae]|uniref:hypothetical protein n=1 Tax=Streptomyces tendae TaxID=1932 RepID=UPI0036CD1E60
MSFARITALGGPVQVAQRAVFAALQQDGRYVTDGVGDLDALGEISALSGTAREQTVNGLRAYGAAAGALRPWVDGAADVIERGPDPEPAKAPTARRTRKPKAARKTA